VSVHRPHDLQAHVEVGCEDRTNQTSHDKFGELPVSLTDAVRGLNEIAQDTCPVLAWLEKMLNCQRKVLRESIVSFDEPGLGLKPGLPLSELDLLGQNGAAFDLVGEHAFRDALNTLGREWHSGRKRRSGAKQQNGTGFVGRSQQGRQELDRISMLP
jgi:hypothetical protein